MAFRFVLNMELLSLSIAKTCITSMTDSNYDDSQSRKEELPVPDDQALINNLSLGFVAITMLNCYYESFLNSILRDHLGFSANGSVLKGSEGEKLEIIFNGNESALERIKADVDWRDAHRIFKLRNHLVHFKNNVSADYSSYPPIDSWKVGGETLGDFFRKSKMETGLAAVQQLVANIASALGLVLGDSNDPIICDFPYVYGNIEYPAV